MMKRIDSYSLGFPSENTRYVTRLELIGANKVSPLSKWTVDYGTKYIRSLQSKVSPSSLIVKGRRLHGYFNWEIRQGLRSGLNPIDPRVLPKVRNTRSPQVLNENEINQLIKKIPKATWTGLRDHTAISLMLICGYRISTVTALNWCDLQKQNGDWVLNTKSKGNVYSSRKMRPDLVKLLLKYKAQTLGLKNESC